MGYALVDAIALTISTWTLVVILWIKNEEHASLLFTPYALWLMFALYLNKYVLYIKLMSSKVNSRAGDLLRARIISSCC